MAGPNARPPKVSVVIPCYLQADFVAQAVESVVGQTYRDWEVLIVDDGSPDATAATAERLIAAHPDRSIRLIRQSNQGTPGARNSGIAASTGRYILPLDADDQLLPGMLEKTIAVLDADPTVAIAYTDYSMIGIRRGPVRTRAWTLDELSFGNPLGNSSLFRRDVWAAVGGYNPNMRGGYEDWDLWIAAAERGFAARRVAEPLWLYRTQETSRNVDAIRRERDLLRQLARNHPTLFTPGRRFRNFLRRGWATIRGRILSTVRSVQPAS